MKFLRLIFESFVFVCLISFLGVVSEPQAEVKAEHSSLSVTLAAQTIANIEASAIDYRNTGKKTAVSLGINTKDGLFDIFIEPHDIRASDYVAQLSGSGSVSLDSAAYETDLFKGVVNTGISTDFARFALIPNLKTGTKRLSGFVRVNDVYYSIEPEDESNQKLSVRVVQSSDLKGVIARCGVDHSYHLSDDNNSKLGQDIFALAQAQVATEADFEYVQALGSGSSANAEILAILNGVDAIYQTQLNLTLTVSFQNAWTTSADPYTNNSSDTILDQFGSYWEANFRRSQSYDLAHLWSGKTFDAGVAGLAFVRAVCSGFGYGIGRHFSSRSLSVPLAAHEIGHSFGAVHDTCNAAERFVMCPFLIVDASIFSPTSKSDIASFVSSISCLSSVDDPDDPDDPVDGSAPVLGFIGSQSVAEGETLTISLSATDADGDSFSFSSQSLPALPDGATLSSSTFTYVVPFDAVSNGAATLESSVMFSVTDTTGLSDSEAVVITVTNVNRPPSISVPSLATIAEGSLLLQQVGASDPDNETLSFSAPNGMPAGASLDSQTGIFSWRPAGDQSGNYTVRLQVIDVFGAIDSADYSISVSDVSGIAPNPSTHIVGDFSALGSAQVSVYRPVTGQWFWQNFGASGVGVQASTSFGLTGDVPVAADYNGDRITDIAVFRPSLNMWFVKNSGTDEIVTFSFGVEGDLPAAGDYDGDARADVAVFRPSLGVLIYKSSRDGATDVVVSIGAKGDIPVPCDYDGDGVTDVAVYRPSTGMWIVGETSTQLGLDSDIPIPADYDGDGACERAVWRPNSGQWYIEGFGGPIQFGLGGDVPMASDLDGDGARDLVVWRPSSATWFWWQGDGSALVHAFGLPNDVIPLQEVNYYAMRNSNKKGTAGLSVSAGGVDLFLDLQDSLSSVGPLGLSSASIVANSGAYILRGDYNGDEVSDVAVYSQGIWTIYFISGVLEVISTTSVPWGVSTDIPVAADFDGDGKTDIAIYRPIGAAGGSEWWIVRSSNGLALVYSWGLSTDFPLPADYNGDGFDDPTVWRPGDGNWYTLDARSSQPLAVTPWGLRGDFARVADYDSDGRPDKVVWRESIGTWFVLFSGGSSTAVQWGLPGDIPVPGRYASSSSFDYAIYRPGDQTLYVLSQNGAQSFQSAASILSSSNEVVVGVMPYSALGNN